MDISVIPDENLNAVSEGLSGWKRDVFLTLGQFDETFKTAEVSIIAQQLGDKYPYNNYREAKVRQVLQQLRDLGLVEFTSPGVYRRLWV
jgi:type II restriction enzyme